MNGKNIFVTIEYVAKKILEAITGHKSDPQAHPNLSEQINVLLQRNHLPAKDNRGVVTKPSDYKSQFTFAGLKSEGVTGLPTWSHVFGVNAYSGIDGFTNVYEYAFCNGEMYIRNQYPLNEDTWGEWKQLATTSKTDILQCLTNGWQVGGNCDFSATKIGNRLFVEGIVFNQSTPSNMRLAVNLPRPSDGRWHGGYMIGLNNTSIYLVINPQGEIELQAGGYIPNIYYSVSIDYPV